MAVFKLGKDDYRRAGKERLEESGILLQRERFAGSVYLAGRAVKSMLRAIIWKGDTELQSGKKSLDTGHDLRNLFQWVMGLGLLRHSSDRELLHEGIQRIARRWFNNMRFVSTEKLKNVWWERKVIDRRCTLKQAAQAYYDDCSAVVKRCEVLL